MPAPEPNPDRANMAPILRNGLGRLTDEQHRLEKAVADLDRLIETRLETTLHQLNPYAVTRSEGHLAQYIRGHKGRVVRSRVLAWWLRVRKRLGDRLVQLLYQRSEGVLFARRLQATDAAPRTLADSGLALLEATMPRPQVLQALPFFYRQLFLDAPAITKDLWVGWQDEQAEARKAVERYRRGFRGALMITGEPLGGKTALSHLIAGTHFKADHIHYMDPPDGGSADVAELEARLLGVLGGYGSVEACFERLPEHSALVLNDVGRWWERSASGFAAVDRLLDLIDRYGDRCFFILNANTHVFRFMNRIRDLDSHFLSVIVCAPSNAEEIKEVILLRHRSTGLKFELEGQAEDALSSWKQAKLFTAFFDYARGNIGVALQAWIAHIQKAGKDGLVLSTPAPPEVEVLEYVTPVQTALLVQFALHEELTPARLLRICTLEATPLQVELESLKRAGLLLEDRAGVWRLNRFVAPHLIHALIKKGLL